MSSWVYGTKYKIEGKWVTTDKAAAEFGGECTSIEVDDDFAPKITFETAGEDYYPQTMYSWHEDRVNWEIGDEVFALHVLGGPGKLERPYQKYVSIENKQTESYKKYKLVEITEEEYEDTREWYKSVSDQIWCADSQWDSLPTKDRIDNEDPDTLPADENGFVIKGTSLYQYDESIGGPIVNIPEGIKRIKANAFSKCKGITQVYIPDSVTSIGDACFSGCKNLVTVRLPEGLTIIYDYMFDDCESLREITLPSTVTSIGVNSFACCKSLEEMVMPQALRVIGDRAFQASTGLKKITLNSGLEKIEWSAFFNCASLTELHIPASVTEIGNSAFQGCTALESITVDENNEIFYAKNNCLIDRGDKALVLACDNSVIPVDGSVKRIAEWAFSNCTKIESIILPESMEYIARYAFSGCGSLKDIQLPKNLSDEDASYRRQAYGEGLFEKCSSLEHFEIPCWMTEISNGMFRGCESLKEIMIPDSVTKIDGWAFADCKSLTELVIPKSVKSIGSNWGTPDNGHFIDGCSSLRRLEIEEGNPVYHSRDNCIIETKTGTLFAIAENGVIPSDGSVTVIGDNAFCACQNISEISLPECITRIGDNAFSKISNLKKINIPQGVNYIGRYAFNDILEGNRHDAVETENGVYYIGNWALGTVREKEERKEEKSLPFGFTSKYRFKEVLPESGEITIREGTVGICANAFSQSQITTAYLPDSLKYICDHAFSTHSLKSISIPGSVERISDYTFNACEGLESLTLNEGLVAIGNSAFNCCKNLQSLTIPHTVKSIEEDAFRFCTGLQSLIIPDVEIEIGVDAFGYCDEIANMEVPERILAQFNKDDGGYAEYLRSCEGKDEITPAPEIDAPDLPF